MRRTREHENSVKVRLMDLLETNEGEWFTIQQLVVEYSRRFGEVKLDTLRRSIFRELAHVDCEMFVRYVDSWPPQHAGLEVAWRMEEA